MKIKVFDYLSELDCFVVRKEFKDLMERLGLSEWTPVVWLGRLFCMDNDFGEHWHDRWDERELVVKKAKELGMVVKQCVIEINGEKYDEDELMIVAPDAFTDHGAFCMDCKKRVKMANCPDCGKSIHVGPDGPCNEDTIKKLFWTDVLHSLHLDLTTIFTKARENKHRNTKKPIEQIIKGIENDYGIEAETRNRR